MVKADCMQWLHEQRPAQFDLIMIDAPTYSNSSGLHADFDIQQDHVELIEKALHLLSDDGDILFANHFRQFKLDTNALEGLEITDISAKTLPADFARNQRMHRSWHIKKKTASL